MSKISREEYTKSIKSRYKKSAKLTKTQILNEYCEVSGLNRKYAIRKLNSTKYKRRKQHPGRPKQYKDPILLRVLLHLWRVMNLPCSKQLKAAIPLWLPFYKKEMLPSDIYK